MEEILIENYKFIRISIEEVEMIFSTAENDLDFNKGTEKGRRNLENLKSWFNVDKVGFVDQVQGDSIIVYDENNYEADALVTDLKHTAVGVFTADCVPILLYDRKNKAIAAVHSGWKGTFECILLKTIEKMGKKFGTKGEDIIAGIGPHNRQCCYEVGEEIVSKFKNCETYKNINLFSGRNLSMIDCIKHQLKLKGVTESNVYDTNICTFCSKDPVMYSYRKNKNGGRMFSFVLLR